MSVFRITSFDGKVLPFAVDHISCILPGQSQRPAAGGLATVGPEGNQPAMVTGEAVVVFLVGGGQIPIAIPNDVDPDQIIDGWARARDAFYASESERDDGRVKLTDLRELREGDKFRIGTRSRWEIMDDYGGSLPYRVRNLDTGEVSQSGFWGYVVPLCEEVTDGDA